MTTAEQKIAALVELHRGLAYLGPGDRAFSHQLLARLTLPRRPRVADLGCGTGASALLLAEVLQTRIKAVDCFQSFLDQLMARARQRGLEGRIEAIQADMGQLDWPKASLDLIWSEGAAYNLTFGRALQCWRPLLVEGGLAVISEVSWFREDIPERLREYWQVAYPAIASEAENIAVARQLGFALVEQLRLPAEAWWRNYYDPLQERIRQLRADPEAAADEAMQAVIRETEEEMALFREYSDYYGYSFYVLIARSQSPQ